MFLIFFGCTDIFESLEEDDYDEDSNSSYIFEIEPRLPIDENGYYHMNLLRLYIHMQNQVYFVPTLFLFS